MKFCMITTFFGAHSFGGDAAYVDRLCQALCRRGHEVHVFYCVDAFNAVRGEHPLREYTPPPGLHLHPLEEPVRHPLAAGDPGDGPALVQVRRAARGARRSRHRRRAFPQHLAGRRAGRPGPGREPACRADHDGARALADLPDAPALEIRPQALRRAELRAAAAWRAAGRRRSGGCQRRSSEGLRQLDALVFPSRHALEEHRRRGLGAFVPLVHLPYFLPDGWSGGIEDEPPERARAAVPRRRRAAGEDEGLPAADPDDALPPRGRPADRRDRPVRGRACARWPATCRTSRSRGSSAARRWPGCFASARAVVVPSLFPETFGYVVLEAFAVRTPVVVHEGGGALYETGVQSGGGLGYRTDVELLTALRRMVHDDDLHDELAARGYAMRMGEWSETEHLDRYFGLIDQAQAAREQQPYPRPHALAGAPRSRRVVDQQRSRTEPRRREGLRWLTARISADRFATIKEPSTVPQSRWRPAGLAPVVVLIALAAVCFARLVAHPSGLIVDGERPSVDYANPGDPRPVGNDLIFLFLPHHMSIAQRIAEFGHLPVWDARGFGGRPLVGNPQAGMFYPPVWVAWWCGAPAALGWLTVAHLLWGGLGVYRAGAIGWSGRWAATVAAGATRLRPFSWRIPSRAIIRTSGRPAGIPGHSGPTPQCGQDGRAGCCSCRSLALTYLTGHPQEWFLLVLALSVWSLSDTVAIWRKRARDTPRSSFSH